MFSSTFKTPSNNRNSNDDRNTDNNNEFTNPLITTSSNNENLSSIYLGDASSRLNSQNEANILDLNNKFKNCLPDLNNQKPKHSNMKAKIYNFLERPTGWLVFQSYFLNLNFYYLK